MINSKAIMLLAALMQGLTGIVLIFFNSEIAEFFGLARPYSPVLQVLGAFYFGFAMTNWTARASLMGGIYGRAILVGNFTQFMITSLILFRGVSAYSLDYLVSVLASVNLIFALSFGYLMFSDPLRGKR
ncbi:MAG: hypothetical protein ACI8QD_000585 [Cyclobacteriaceae bacterium]|jgi:hypothetical protein